MLFLEEPLSGVNLMLMKKEKPDNLNYANILYRVDTEETSPKLGFCIQRALA